MWEAKGSTGAISADEKRHAKDQKMTEPADLAFACFAEIKSDCATEVSLEDPPLLPYRGEDLERQFARVMHYVNVFRFIGQSGLSQRYFELMGKRIESDINFPEFDEKQRLFVKSVKIQIYGRHYLGNIQRIGNDSYLYAGFDESLVSVQGFLAFVDYTEDMTFKQHGNTFQISRDGICYGYITDLKLLETLGARPIDVNQIFYYWDNFTIRDTDYMLHFQLVEFAKYLFQREGFEVQKESFLERRNYDLVVMKKEKMFAVEVKKDVIIKTFDQLKNFRNHFTPVIITIVNVSDEDIQYAKDFGVLIIDRRRLRSIIWEERKIWGFLRHV